MLGAEHYDMKRRQRKVASVAAAADRLKILTRIDRLISAGKSNLAACREVGVSGPTVWRWRKAVATRRGLEPRFSSGRISILQKMSAREFLLLAELSRELSWGQTVARFCEQREVTVVTKARISRMKRPTRVLVRAMALVHLGRNAATGSQI